MVVKWWLTAAEGTPAVLCHYLCSAATWRPHRSDEMLLDEIGRHIMRFTHELGAADIAALVHGYSLLDHSPSVVLFDALAARAAQVTADFTAEQAAHVVAGYQRLGYTAKAPVLAHTPMLP